MSYAETTKVRLPESVTVIHERPTTDEYGFELVVQKKGYIDVLEQRSVILW